MSSLMIASLVAGAIGLVGIGSFIYFYAREADRWEDLAERLAAENDRLRNELAVERRRLLRVVPQHTRLYDWQEVQ